MTNKIEVIGLGAGDIEQLSLGIYKKLTCQEQQRLFLRTVQHPVVKTLENEGINFISFDTFYEEEEQFANVYERIVETLVKEAKSNNVLYAVPGHPMLAERTVQLLLEQSDVDVDIVGGQSYLDDLFTALKIDPIEGFQFIDGTSFKRSELQYEHHQIFCQVYDRLIASDIKLALLEDLPANFPVTIVEAAGSENEVIQTITLEELDRNNLLSNLTSVYVPPIKRDKLPHTFNRLKDVIATLRGPEGCSWDKKQTHQSLRPYAVEEVYELLEAIDNEEDEGIIEELGDVLLQVMLHSQIGEDAGYFTIDDVIRSITNKMIHRHPHVFNVNCSENYKTWDELKREEKSDQKQQLPILDNIPVNLPALARAHTIQKKAAKVGFDWDDVKDIWAKLAEEIDEFKAAVTNKKFDEIELELGDILFVIANIARFYKINPEVALNRTNNKFITRFSFIERMLRDKQQSLTDTSLEEMDFYWEQSKREE